MTNIFTIKDKLCGHWQVQLLNDSKAFNTFSYFVFVLLVRFILNVKENLCTDDKKVKRFC